MKDHTELLKSQICEQIALEEHLLIIIEEQIREIDGNEFDDAKNLLTKTKNVLARHFVTLNELLDKTEQNASAACKESVASNGVTLNTPTMTRAKISKILQDDYSALNKITISNTLLHTLALALDYKEVATTALKHLENLTPFVIRIGELMPEVVTRELYRESPEVDLTVAKTALRNIKLAWQKAS